MRSNDKNNTHDLDKKINYLESKVKNILKTVEYVNDGNYENAENSLQEYKESTAFIPMASLVQKSAGRATFPKDENDKTYLFLKIVLNSMPFPVFIKDEKGRYLLVNKQEEELFGMLEPEIIGKKDADFVKDEDELEIIEKSDHEVLVEGKHIELPNQSFTVEGGKRSYVFKTHKLPFINPITGKPNLLGFSVDITDTVNLDKLKKILIMNSPYL